MEGLAAISGLASGINWRDIVDQIIAIDHERVKLVAGQRDKFEVQQNEWKGIQSLLTGLKSVSADLKKADAFRLFNASLTSSSSKAADDILTVSTTNSAARGSYNIRVLQKAQSLKVGSSSFESRNDALNLNGEFIINGHGLSVNATDTLEDIRDKINGLDTGADPTNVTATIISKSETSFQIALTSGETGVQGFSLLDAGSNSNILQDLGFASATVSLKNRTSDGAKSDEFTSSATAVATLRGLNTQTGPETVTIAGQSVNIDLSTESLSDIAANINALAGVTATVASSEGDDGGITYQLDISGTSSFTDSGNVLQALGVLASDRSSINEHHAGSTAFTQVSGAGGGAISDATLLSQINTGGDTNNISLNDTVTITGKDNSGTAVTATFTVTDVNQALDAEGGLLKTIESAFGGELAVDAYISDGSDGHSAGQLVLKDLVTGDSQLEFNVFTNNEGGGTLDFGSVSESITGRDMELVAGQDAVVEVDNVNFTRSTNSISDLISGATLNLVAADEDTALTLDVARDVDKIKSEIKTFVDKFNEITSKIHSHLSFDSENQTPGGILFGDGTLRRVQTELLGKVVESIEGLSSSYSSLSLIGISLDDNNLLEIDDGKLTGLLNSNYADVMDLLNVQGTGSTSSIQFVSHTLDTEGGDFDINITTAAEKATSTGTLDLSAGIVGNETITITDQSTSRVATIALTAGDDIDEVVSKINTELSAKYAQVVSDSQVNTKTSASGGGNITAGTLWSEINTNGDANDVADGDTISFTGTRRGGGNIAGSYTISDKSTDTVQGLLSAIESSYNNEVYATIGTNGSITVTDRETGTSQLSIDLIANNEGGGSLSFGTASTVEAGRYNLEVSASKNENNQLVISHSSYGSSFGFSVSQTASNLGITDGSYSGIDVAGTINGEAASGTGQVLDGDNDAANIDGLSIRYTGESTGDVGSISLTLGFFEELDRKLFAITDNFEGYVNFKMDSLADNVKRFGSRIEDMESSLDQKRSRLVARFLSMEQTIAKLNSQGAWLSSMGN